jgi:hypothetical protein
VITSERLAFVREQAYVPEHLIDYVTSVSKVEPFLFGAYLGYFKKGVLIFNGYPLGEIFEEKGMTSALNRARKRFGPDDISLVAPRIPSALAQGLQPPSDSYFRLEVSRIVISQKLRNVLKRASRDLRVEKCKTFGYEHRVMVEGFLASHPVEEGTGTIFRGIPEYLSLSSSAWVFEARDREGTLVAFDVADFGAAHYAMYMFNFTSRTRSVPGASDLLLFHVIRSAKEERKRFVNLGLGINPGVAFFKRKWGAVPFCSYAVYHASIAKRKGIDALLEKL